MGAHRPGHGQPRVLRHPRRRPLSDRWLDVDLIVCGHNHAYERFAQQDHTGLRSTKGIRSVIAGTGGQYHIGFRSPVALNSLVRIATQHGMLRMILRPDGWIQGFRTTDGTSHDVLANGCRP